MNFHFVSGAFKRSCIRIFWGLVLICLNLNSLASGETPSSVLDLEARRVGQMEIHPTGSHETTVKVLNEILSKASLLTSPRDVSDSGAVYLGDRIETLPEQSVAVRLVDGSEVNLGPGSDLVIQEFDRSKDSGSTQIEIHKGVIHVLVPKNLYRAKKHFYVKTPVAVMGVRGTEFIVEHDELYGSRVHTFEGTVALGKNTEDLENTQTTQLVGAGRMSRIESSMLHPLEPALFEAREFLSKLHPRFLRHLKHRNIWSRLRARN